MTHWISSDDSLIHIRFFNEPVQMTQWIGSDNSLTEWSDLKACNIIVNHAVTQFNEMLHMWAVDVAVSSLSLSALSRVWMQPDLLFIKLSESFLMFMLSDAYWRIITSVLDFSARRVSVDMQICVCVRTPADRADADAFTEAAHLTASSLSCALCSVTECSYWAVLPGFILN